MGAKMQSGGSLPEKKGVQLHGTILIVAYK